MCQKKQGYLCLIHIGISIVMGVIIYILVRPDTYISRIFRDIVNISGVGDNVSAVCPRPILQFLRYYASDFLWAYALTFAIFYVLRNDKRGILIADGICFVFESSIELLQKFQIVSGTFDWLDILCEFCATAIASLIIKYIRRTKNENNP